MSKRTELWAIYDRAGRIRNIGLFYDEPQVWRICLGYPSDEEIRQAKARGLWAVRVDVIPREVPIADIDDETRKYLNIMERGTL